MYRIITPIPTFPHRGGRGFCALTPALALRERGNVVAVGVGEAVLDEVLGCFHAVADFDALGFAAHGVGEEGGDVVAVFGDVVYVLLQLF